MSYEKSDKNNKIIIKNVFVNIKSKFILKRIFFNLDKKLLLIIIKISKILQKKLDLSLTNYINFYTTIEIELKPAPNKYGEFIHFNKLKESSNYHIYFDNNNKEIKRNFIMEKDKTKKITILIDDKIKSFKALFLYCECIEYISFKRFYRKDIINMSEMFSGCTSLKQIDFFKFNTDNVTNMKFMFSECSSLIELNLSNFNSEKVKNMSYMFNKCSSLKYIDLSNFKTNEVTDMSYMFNKCSSLEQIDISKFNVNNVNNMVSMFSGCSNDLKMKIQAQNKNIRDGAYINE